jgi:hypothetical protein
MQLKHLKEEEEEEKVKELGH